MKYWLIKSVVSLYEEDESPITEYTIDDMDVIRAICKAAEAYTRMQVRRYGFIHHRAYFDDFMENIYEVKMVWNDAICGDFSSPSSEASSARIRELAESNSRKRQR